MADVPLILVVGGDALAVRVCEELCSTQGHRVALVWPHDHELSKQLERIKCEYLPFAPNDYEALRSVGVPDATSLMALAEDDRVAVAYADPRGGTRTVTHAALASVEGLVRNRLAN